MPHRPPSGLSTSLQKNTMPPPIIPAMAPAQVVRFQKREKSTSVPNVAPKPAHANDTSVKMMLFSSSAMTIPK